MAIEFRNLLLLGMPGLSLVLVLGAGGCTYAPAYQGARCYDDSTCPPGYTCVSSGIERICTRQGADAGQDAGADAGNDGHDSAPSDGGDPGQADPGDSGGDPGTDAGDPASLCGNQSLDPGETCDDGVNDGSYDGCMPGCRFWGPRCGDGYKNGPEACDGIDLTGISCERQGFLNGVIACLPDCGADLAGCVCPFFHRLVIDGGKVAEPLSDFPVLVDLSADYLRQVAEGGTVTSPAGDDIQFFAADRTTRLDHDLDRYQADATEGRLIAWVRLPDLPAGTDTVLYLCHGDPAVTSPTSNPAVVWTNGYAGVWHFNDALDASGQNLQGEAHGSPPAPQDGKIGLAQGFDGDDDEIRVAAGPALDLSEAITLSIWVYPEDKDNKFRLVGKWYFNDQDWSYVLYTKVGEGFRLWDRQANRNFVQMTHWSSGLANRQWRHLAATWQAIDGVARVYIDGLVVEEQVAAGLIAVTDNPLQIGNDGYDDHRFRGLADELHLAKAARTQGWIQTEVENQRDPGSFYRVEEVTPPWP